MKTKKTKTGTREWAGTSVNIGLGCPHNCRYCYAATSANRFGRVERADWGTYRPKTEWIAKWLTTQARFPEGCMFPTSHDFNEYNWKTAFSVVNNLTANGNDVLLVTKGGPYAKNLIDVIVSSGIHEGREGKIELRVSIGSSDDDVLRFWEPGAPPYFDRVNLVVDAGRAGLSTSISAEPFLDGAVLANVLAMSNLPTGDIWVGLLRKFRTRVNQSEITDDERGRFVDPLLGFMDNPDAMAFLVEALAGIPQVRYKDSLVEWATENKDALPVAVRTAIRQKSANPDL